MFSRFWGEVLQAILGLLYGLTFTSEEVFYTFVLNLPIALDGTVFYDLVAVDYAFLNGLIAAYYCLLDFLKSALRCVAKRAIALLLLFHG